MTDSIRLLDAEPCTSDLRREIIAGLQKPLKELPCKLFYDERGSKLFALICKLDEYYLTRTELAIMKDNINEIITLIGPQCKLIEFGSGTSEKTRILLSHLQDLSAYVPIDISKSHLMNSAQLISAEYPGLEVLPVCADYNHRVQVPQCDRPVSIRVVYFPGSTIGNFHPHEAIRFLEGVAELGGADGSLLIGVDLKKNPQTLNLAYNDHEGITAEFNLNALVRINQEFGANFAIQQFRHEAFYNESKGRIEAYLVSLESQTVHIGGIEISFKPGERIWTESSYKYTIKEFGELAGKAGFEVRKVWTDVDRLFSVQFLVMSHN